MVFNSQLSGDQLAMLNLGWQLAHNHVWLPHGMITSAGGFSPGGLTGLLVGAQLSIWNDYRSPALFTLLLNAAAFLLLARAVRPLLSPFGSYLLLILVWLSPWHLYFSAHVWDPNYMFLFAVLHLATAQRLASHKEAGTTTAHVLILGFGVQIHTSAAILCVLSLLLYARKRIQLHPAGVALGALIVGLSLVPWVTAVHTDSHLMPGSKGFLLRGIVLVFPFLKGVLYWLKMSSLSFVDRMNDVDFAPVLGAALAAWLLPLAKGLSMLAHSSLVPATWMQWRFFRKARRALALRRVEPGGRPWLRTYVAAMFVAALLCFAVSPTTVMFWQVLIALPASALATVMGGEALVRTRHRPYVRWTAHFWGLACVALLLCQAVAAPMYRCGAYHLGPPDPMLADIHARRECFR
jgi:hypothetical protein